MTEKIKEILDRIKNYPEKLYCLNETEKNILLDYITNLQQDLDKAIDTIGKDRQFYKCRMDEYIDLKKENERLKGERQRLLYNLEKVCEERDEEQ